MIFLDDIFTYLVDMPCGIRGHCNPNPDGSYTICINARMGYEEQLKTYLHEIEHIKGHDFEKYDVIEIENEVRRRLHERSEKRR